MKLQGRLADKQQPNNIVKVYITAPLLIEKQIDPNLWFWQYFKGLSNN